MSRYYIYVMVVISLLLSGCFDDEKLVFKKGKYNILECKEELSVGKDLIEEKKIDKIVVYKSKREMNLYRDNDKIYTFRISLGKRPKGRKIKRGDHKTPEGSYTITRKMCNSKYYRMIYTSYPNHDDKIRAKKMGLSPGSGITIHAQPFWNADGKGDNYTLSKDWTNGCIAISNSSMDILWYALKLGTPIEIKK